MNLEMKEIATVTAVHRDRYELCVGAEDLYGKLKTACFYNTPEIVEFPTVGDEVELIRNELGDSLITKVLPRKSVFMRQNVTQGQNDLAIAANFDYVFITMSLNRDFHLSKLERYVTVAWQSGGVPIIILTKADLCEEPEDYVVQAESVAPGVEIYCVSSVTGEGVAQLERFFKEGKTTVLLGSSGVGKSSFVNMLMGKEEMLTGGIREADAQGRHTTTYKQSMNLPKEIVLPNGEVVPGGGRIIDTPGIRKLLVTDVDEGLQTSFEDVEELFTRCRFSNCGHKSEPGCAIRSALEDGSLEERRWKTYLHMQREEAFAREKKAIIQRRMEKAMRRRT